MVLEHLFPEDWLEKRVGYAFIIAVVYSILGIALTSDDGCLENLFCD